MIKEGYADILKDNVRKSAASLDSGCCCIFILLTTDCQKAINFCFYLSTSLNYLQSAYSIIIVLVIFMKKGFVGL